MSETIKSHIYEQGLRGSDDVQARLDRDEIRVVLHGGDGESAASLDYGAAGSVKRNTEGKIVAQHGSAEFIRDFDDSRDTLAAREALAELKRRGSV